MVSCGIRTPFGILSPCEGKVAHALLTRPPLKLNSFQPKPSVAKSPLDLHVLGTPPAFVLSQDQTLKFNPSALPFSNVSNSQNQLSFFLAFLLNLCIVFKVRRSRRSLFILPLHSTLVNTFFEVFGSFFHSFVFFEFYCLYIFLLFVGLHYILTYIFYFLQVPFGSLGIQGYQ